jgi:ectoine hydroxylase-related dioxygenase (phytanoyl-CoA dioxygenase family)
MLSRDQLHVLSEDGVLHIPGFFSAEDLERLVRESSLIMRDESLMCPRDEHFYERHGSDNATFVDCHMHGEFLRSLAEGSRLAGMAECVLSHGSVFHTSLLQVSQPGRGQGTSWHQDVDPETCAGSLYNFLIYPEDLTPETGPLVYVPGSHRWGVLPAGEHFAPIEGQRTLLARAGDLVIVNGTVFHCVPRNRTDRRRFSLNFRFRDARVPRSALTVGVYRNGKFDYSKGVPVPSSGAQN